MNAIALNRNILNIKYVSNIFSTTKLRLYSTRNRVYYEKRLWDGLGETMTKPDNLPPRVLLKVPQISVVGAKKALILNYSYLLIKKPAFFAKVVRFCLGKM